MMWALPIVLFISGAILENKFGGGLAPSGVIVTLFELLIVGLSLLNANRFPRTGRRAIATVLAGFAIGDFAYGVSNYALKLNFPNQLGCLTYVVPYLLSMSVLACFMSNWVRRIASPGVFVLSIIIFLAFFALNSWLIIYPAIFIKSPALSPLLKSLTVIFTLVESYIVALSIVLLALTISVVAHTALFGVLVMHISDIAIRYQSVDLSLLGMSMFENGWCLGLSLISAAILMANQMDESALKREVEKSLPLASIRGLLVGFVLASLSGLWAILLLFFGHGQGVNLISATLLVAVGIFALAIAGANILTGRLSEITLNLQANGEASLRSSAWGLPKEIEVISTQFQSILHDLKRERDHALKLSTRLAHDLRSPIVAIGFVKDEIAKLAAEQGPLDAELLSENFEILDVASGAIQQLSGELLTERKRLLDLEPLAEATKGAVRIVQASHPTAEIHFSSECDSTSFQIRGLTRVLTNILNNAVEASPSGAPVHVRIKRDESAYVIEVEDRGPGISESVMNQIRVGTVVTTKSNGNGIGMASMYSWARQEGVSVQIESHTSGLRTGTKVLLGIPT